jgi:hypothetical protein
MFGKQADTLPAYILLLCAIEAGDLLDSVKMLGEKPEI